MQSVLAHQIANSLYSLGNKVDDDVRNIISMAYKQTKPIMYVFKDCDNMSNAAKNALLKVIEEPHNRLTFVMLLKKYIKYIGNYIRVVVC